MAITAQQVISTGKALGKSDEEIRRKLAETGNLSSGAIDELGALSNGLEGTMTNKPAVSDAEKSKTTVMRESTNNLLRQAQEYRSALAKGGFALKGTKEYGDLAGLRSSMLTTIKSAENLGTLDQGLLDFSREILGEDPSLGLTQWNVGGRKSNEAIGKIDRMIKEGNSKIGMYNKLLGESEEIGSVESGPKKMHQDIRYSIEQAMANPENAGAKNFLEEIKNGKWDLENGVKLKSYDELNDVEKYMADNGFEVEGYKPEPVQPTEEQEEMPEGEEKPDEELSILDRMNPFKKIADVPDDLIDFGKDVFKTFGEVKESFGEASDKYSRGEQGLASSTLQALGGIGKGIGSLAGNVVTGVTKLGLSEEEEVDLKNKFEGAITSLAQTETGQEALRLMEKGGAEWKDFADEHPELSENIKAVAGIVDGVTTVLSAGQAGTIKTIGKEALETTGKVGLKAVGKAGKPLVSGVEKVADVGKKIVKKTPEIEKITGAVEDVTRKYKPLSNFAETARKKGVDVKKEIIDNDLLRGSVDESGMVTTIGEGGVVEGYEKKFIDGLDSKLSDSLKANKETITADKLKERMMEGLEKSDLAGTAKDKAESRINKEMESLLKLADDNGNIPLERINRVKQLTGTKVGKGFDVEKESLEESLFDALRNVIEKETKSVDVKDINKQLSKHYTTRDFLKLMDGKKVEGSGLTKMASDVTSTLVGGGAGAMAGGPIGALLGAGAGKTISNKIQGKAFKNAFGKVGKKAEKQIENIAKNAKSESDLVSKMRPILEKKTGRKVTKQEILKALGASAVLTNQAVNNEE